MDFFEFLDQRPYGMPRAERQSALMEELSNLMAHHAEDELHNLAMKRVSRGGYRVVPIEDALSFSEIWDGIPLLDHMIRQIVVQT